MDARKPSGGRRIGLTARQPRRIAGATQSGKAVDFCFLRPGLPSTVPEMQITALNLKIDHLAVSADTLAEAVAHVEAALGVAMGPGGAHPQMGTHNRLISLGPGVYLEAIAIDPAAPAPGRPRWFDLDARSGPARLSNWIVRSEALTAALAQAPLGAGTPMALQRAGFKWTMAVPEDGKLPFGGACPALIEWQGAAHPADRLPQSGCALKHLEVLHPDIEALLAGFPALAGVSGVTFLAAPSPGLRATIATPFGLRVLT